MRRDSEIPLCPFLPQYPAFNQQMFNIYSLIFFPGVAVASFFGSETMEFTAGEPQQQIGDFALTFQMRTRSTNVRILNIVTDNMENITVSRANFPYCLKIVPLSTLCTVDVV